MNRKTILILIVIVIVLCGSGALFAAGGTGLYLSTQGNKTAVEPAAPTLINPQAQPPAGKATTAEIDGMTLVYVPAGEFLMGSTEAQFQAAIIECVKDGGTQADCIKSYGDEKPAHTVYLDAFRIDQTDVTNAMYAKCVGAGACTAPSNLSSSTRKDYYSNDQYADYPVINVDWNQADAYCTWAGRSLPTEAQWEKAARGTDGRIYPWGNQEPNNSLLNFDQQKTGDTTRVGSYPAGASPYGALDMAGNVKNWAADWYATTYISNSPKRNPTGPDSGTERVLRGSSWAHWGPNSRSALRNHSVPSGISDKLSSFGFRCAVSPSSTTARKQPLTPTEEASTAPVEEATAAPTEEATAAPVEEATAAPDSEATQAPQAATEVPAFFKVYFKTDCNKTARFSIHYKNLDDAWVTPGWWELQPGEFAYVANTKNTIYYYYGEPVNGGLNWWGTDLSLKVNNGSKFYGFKEFDINQPNWGQAIQSFICP